MRAAYVQTCQEENRSTQKDALESVDFLKISPHDNSYSLQHVSDLISHYQMRSPASPSSSSSGVSTATSSVATASAISTATPLVGASRLCSFWRSRQWRITRSDADIHMHLLT
jgi:hypothetical protein